VATLDQPNGQLLAVHRATSIITGWQGAMGLLRAFMTIHTKAHGIYHILI
jgi:hypothetical protein